MACKSAPLEEDQNQKSTTPTAGRVAGPKPHLFQEWVYNPSYVKGIFRETRGWGTGPEPTPKPMAGTYPNEFEKKALSCLC